MTDRVAELRREIAELRREVADLRRELAAAHAQPEHPGDKWTWPIVYSSALRPMGCIR